MERQKLQEVISEANNAPSGANSQPWSFYITKEAGVRIEIHPEKDHEILNHDKRGTLLALGAMIENIAQVAHQKGYETRIGMFSHETNTISLTLEKAAVQLQDNLAHYIKKRTTNRKPYKDIPLKNKDARAIRNAAISDTAVYRSVFDTERREALARASSIFERVMLEHNKLREISFKEIVWSRKDERKDASGLYIETLELTPPKRFVLRLLKLPPIMWVAKKIGLPKVIAADTAKLYASGGLIGVLTVPDIDANFIEAGRVFERTWLQATACGLSLQPITGVFILGQFIKSQANFFSQSMKKDIEEAYTTARSVLNIPSNHVVAIGFRIGYADSPTMTTKKASPRVTFE